LKEAEELISKFHTVKDTARILGLTEGALRYHIKKGNIKKSGNYNIRKKLSSPAHRYQQDFLVSTLLV